MKTDAVPELPIIEDLFDQDLLQETALIGRIDQKLLSPERLDWIPIGEIAVEGVEDVEIEDVI